MYLLKYRLTTGEIDGLWEAATTEHLHAQIVEGDTTYGYLLSDVATSSEELHRAWHVHDGVLLAKEEVRLVASVARFLADGVTECQVTVEPFVPCTLLVDGATYALTAEDPALTITALRAKVFTITLAPLVTHWSWPLAVEAY